MKGNCYDRSYYHIFWEPSGFHSVIVLVYMFYNLWKIDSVYFKAWVIKDTLKAFDDFKDKKKAYEVMFLICKSMCALEVYSIHYTLR